MSNTSTYRLYLPDNGAVPEADVVYNNLRVNDHPEEDLQKTASFRWHGHRVTVWSTTAGKPMYPMGYNMALWDLAHGDLAVMKTEKPHAKTQNNKKKQYEWHIWRRDVDEVATNDPKKIMSSWHQVDSIAQEYDCPKNTGAVAWQNLILGNLLDPRHKRIEVRRGIRFNNYIIEPTSEGIFKTPVNKDNENAPYELTINTDYSDEVANRVYQVFAKLVADDGSLDNLTRMWAEQILGPFNAHLYVLYGEGGNGKGVLLDSLGEDFPSLARPFDTSLLTNGGFQAVQEVLKFSGTMWNFDAEADTILPNQLTMLKRISAHEEVTGRPQGGNNVAVHPISTVAIATNNPVITTMTKASDRRFVFIRFKDPANPEAIRELLKLRDEYGAAAWIMASCAFWASYGNDPVAKVSISDPKSLSDTEYDIVREIVQRGYCSNDFLSDHHIRISPRNKHVMLDKLGLATVIKKIGDKSQRVMVPVDASRFNVFGEAVAHELDNADKENPEDQFKRLPSYIGGLEPTDLGVPGKFAPAGQHRDNPKAAIGWQHNLQDIPPKTKVVAFAPAPGYAVWDADKGKEGEESGLKRMIEALGEYGSRNFPATLVDSTAHGGFHFFYRIPDGVHLVGKVGKTVHNIRYPHGVPIDLRVGGSNYVLAPGSVLPDGSSYEIVKYPPFVKNKDGKHFVIPEMSKAMVAWLKENGYVKGEKGLPTPEEAQKETRHNYSFVSAEPKRPQRDDAIGGGSPHLDPIPQGGREVTIFKQTLGRVKNHPQEIDRIVREEEERGRKSGLPESEIRHAIKQAILYATGDTNPAI